MPEPLPISGEEIQALLADPQALVRRMVLSFVLERPRRVTMAPGKKPKPKNG